MGKYWVVAKIAWQDIFGYTALALLLVIFFFFVSEVIWRRGLKQYQGASS